MPDETAAILEILRSIGVYDWLTAKVKSESELDRNVSKRFSRINAIVHERRVSMQMNFQPYL